MTVHPWEQYPAGTLICAEHGVATVLPDFDFETYSEAGYLWDPVESKWGSLPGHSNQMRGLKAVGVRNYVQHPSFEVLSLAWDLKDGRGRRWWRPNFCAGMTIPQHHALTDPQELLDYVRTGGLIEAFNVGFEFTVWNYYCAQQFFGWPELSVQQIRCCMAKARACGYPGALDAVGEVLRLHEKKDPAGDKLIRKLTVPRNPTKANAALRWTPITAGEDFERFYEYNRQDIRTEAEASARLPDLSPRELEIWRFDFRCNNRGMHINARGVDDCIAVMEQCYMRFNSELQQLTNYTASNTSEVQKLLAWMSSQGVTLYSLDEDALDEALQRTDYPLAVQRALRLRQMLAFGSVKKLYAFRSQTTAQHRLHDQYVYYGTHTALWNGRGVQPANLYSGIFKKPEQAAKALAIIATRSLELVEYYYGPGSEWVQEGNAPADALEVVASCLRSLIDAAPGHKLISADFSAIQAVATSCLAGEQWRIDVFRTHGKMYEMQAAMLTGKTLQFYLDYRKQHGKHHADRQNYGKIPVLSADFGAWVEGWKKFGADKLGDDAYIKSLILKTRAGIPNIVEFWGGQTRNKFNRAPDGSYANARAELYGLEGAAISAVLDPTRAFAYRNVAYQMHGDVLYCRPPSGGFIAYHKPRLTRATRSQWADPWELELSYEGWNSNAMKQRQGWVRMGLYGGVLTQNVVSNCCREIQADALVTLDTAQPRQYPIVMHTHDEQVAEVPDLPEYNAAEYTQLVRGSLAPWAVCDDGQPWPVNVPDAWEAYSYGKWET